MPRLIYLTKTSDDQKIRVFSKSYRHRIGRNIRDFSRVVFALGIIPNILRLLQFQHSTESSSVVCLKFKDLLKIFLFGI